MTAASRSKRFRGLSLAQMAGWVAMIPVAYKTRWLWSVGFVSVLSLLANAYGSYAAWRSDVNPDAERLQRMEHQLARIESGVTNGD